MQTWKENALQPRYNIKPSSCSLKVQKRLGLQIRQTIFSTIVVLRKLVKRRNGRLKLVYIVLSLPICTLHTISFTNSLNVRRCEKVAPSLQHCCSWPRQVLDRGLFVEEDSPRQATSRLVNTLPPISRKKKTYRSDIASCVANFTQPSRNFQNVQKSLDLLTQLRAQVLVLQTIRFMGPLFPKEDQQCLAVSVRGRRSREIEDGRSGKRDGHAVRNEGNVGTIRRVMILFALGSTFIK